MDLDEFCTHKNDLSYQTALFQGRKSHNARLRKKERKKERKRNKERKRKKERKKEKEGKKERKKEIKERKKERKRNKERKKERERRKEKRKKDKERNFLTTSLRAKVRESMKGNRNMRLEHWFSDTVGKIRVNGVFHHKSLKDWPEVIKTS